MPTKDVSTVVKRAHSGGWLWHVLDLGYTVRTGWAANKAAAIELAKQAKLTYYERLTVGQATLKSVRPSKCRFLFGRQYDA